MRKAELAVDKKQDDLARASLLRVESFRELSENFTQQVADQKAQVENLKSALRQLEQKLTEAQAKADHVAEFLSRPFEQVRRVRQSRAKIESQVDVRAIRRNIAEVLGQLFWTDPIPDDLLPGPGHLNGVRVNVQDNLP